MIEMLYAIEISGVCDLGCSYCPYHKQQRDRGLMDWPTLEKTMSWVAAGLLQANRPLHLHLFGEPLLHPEFESMAKYVKRTWPHISFSTNGVKLDAGRAKKIAEVGVSWVTVSPHDKRAAMKAAFLLRGQKVKVTLHDGPDHGWGGQVDHPVKWNGGCEYAAHNKIVVRWNGDVAVCCIDDGPEAVIGTVWDADLLDKEHKVISLCSTCHLKRKGASNER